MLGVVGSPVWACRAARATRTVLRVEHSVSRPYPPYPVPHGTASLILHLHHGRAVTGRRDSAMSSAQCMLVHNVTRMHLRCID